MALQIRLKKIDPIALTADGGTRGEITTAISSPFILNQIVVISATGVEPFTLRVRRVDSEFTFSLGPIDGDTKDRTDLSKFTTLLNGTIEANEQDRPGVPQQEIERHTFQDEPTVARRSYLVDKQGLGYGKNNPLPIKNTRSGLSLNEEIKNALLDSVDLVKTNVWIKVKGIDVISIVVFTSVSTDAFFESTITLTRDFSYGTGDPLITLITDTLTIL